MVDQDAPVPAGQSDQWGRGVQAPSTWISAAFLVVVASTPLPVQAAKRAIQHDELAEPVTNRPAQVGHVGLDNEHGDWDE